MKITDINILDNAIYICWEDEKLGFGSIDLFHDEENNIVLVDSENMSRSFVKSVFEKIIDDAKFEFE